MIFPRNKSKISNFIAFNIQKYTYYTYKHEIKLRLDMVSKHVFLYLCLPDYELEIR